MRGFVLCTGRSGSVAVARALDHATNVSVGHETRIARHDDRLAYPDQHIEIDNRLTWMLGALGQRYPDAKWVHLTRDPVEVAASYAGRYPAQQTLRHRVRRSVKLLRYGHFGGSHLGEMYAHGVVAGSRPIEPPERQRVMRAMVDTMTANIEDFLTHRNHLRLDISEAADRVHEVWEFFGLEGDMEAARAEFSRRHNAT